MCALTSHARDIVENEGLQLRYYNVIYDVIDDAKAIMGGMLGSGDSRRDRWRCRGPRRVQFTEIWSDRRKHGYRRALFTVP